MDCMNLDKILDKALHEFPINKEEIIYMLRLQQPVQREKLFGTARALRKRYFENKVFLYGFVYFSTYCRNDCTFCFYRSSNSVCDRYRKTKEEIVTIACELAASGVHLIDLTMGEDPKYLSNQQEGYQELIEIIHQVKEKTTLPIMISPGVVPKGVLEKIKEAGADWYACYQETHNRNLYEKLRLDQSYEERWNIKVYAKTMGMLVEEGLLLGIGDNEEDAADSFTKMKNLGADQIRTMSFVPQKGTPLFHTNPQNDSLELNMIAVMRILFPDRLIPASLDVEGIMGLKERLNAGANVVTSIIPSDAGLAGVSQSTLDIAEGYRTVEGVTPLLKECGLIPATSDEYAIWMNGRMRKSEIIKERIL